MTPSADRSAHEQHYSASQLLHDLDTQGYTILRSHISQAQVSQLLHSSRKLTKVARSGQWPHLRTCPKQFPPWPSTPPEEGIWGVQHLLHPGLYKAPSVQSNGHINTATEPPLTQNEAAAFASLYFSSAVLDPITSILSPATPSSNTIAPSSPALTMELLNLLVSPPSSFHLRWHRDSISFSLPPADEAAALGLIQTSHSTATESQHNPFATTEHNYYTLHPAFRQHRHAQYNIPLLPDASLQLVPGSHLRPRTELEITALEGGESTDAMPGAVTVDLQPGDVVFYNANLIHRGVYEGFVDADGTGTERYTIHGSVSRADIGTERARTVLQHGVGEWIEDVDFEGLLGNIQGDDAVALRERALAMRRRLLDLGGADGATSADSVGYHHDG